MAPRKNKSRANGEGTIFYSESKKRWVAEATVRWDENGKRVIKTVYGKTQAEARDKLRDLQANVRHGTFCDAQPQTLAQYMQFYLDTSAKQSVKPTTFIAYESNVRCHILPRLGGVQLSKLAPRHFQALYAAMAEDGVSPRVRQLAHAILHKALDEAVCLELIPRSPMDKVKRPKVPHKTFRVLAPHEAEQFLVAAKGDRLYCLYLLAIATSLRQGEMLGLQWEDIDLKTGHIAVRHTLRDLKGKLELGEPKTEKGRRRIKLPDIAWKALKDHKERMFAEGHAKTWVFCDTNGGALRHNNLTRRSFKPLLKQAGLPDVRFHDLRHTAATLFMSKGINPKVVQEILGHSQISVTMDTYSHVLPTMQDEAAKAMDAILGSLVALTS